MQIPSDHEWQGPAKLNLEFYRSHKRTVRYRIRVGQRWFDVYVPKALLKTALGLAEEPLSLLAIVARSPLPSRELGFLGAPIAPRTDTSFWEYERSEEKARSWRYDVLFNQQPFSLYVPKIVFGEHEAPRRLWLWLGLDDEPRN